MVKKNREAHAAAPSSESEGEDSPSTPPPPSAADKKPAAQKKPAECAAEKAMSSESDDSPLKRMHGSLKRRRPRSKTSYKPSKPPRLMRQQSEPAREKDLKKGKSQGGGVEGKKLKLFPRLFGNDDEIVILKGILEYKEKKGADPMANAADFLASIQKSLRVSVDPTQIRSKVRKLKERYVSTVMGKKKTFSSHERNAFELSKVIWGNVKPTAAAGKIDGSIGRMSNVVMNGAGTSSTQEQDENSWQFIGKAGISMGLNETVVKMGLRLCNEDKKAEIEEKWKQLHLQESILLSSKLDLAREESQMIIEALKSGGEY